GRDARRRQELRRGGFCRKTEGAQDRAACGDQRTVSKTGKPRKTAVPPEVAASLRYAISQRLRKRIEESFGWSKTVGGLRKSRCAASTRFAPFLSSPWPPTPASACPSSWPRECARRHEKPGKNVPTSGQTLDNTPHPGA